MIIVVGLALTGVAGLLVTLAMLGALHSCRHMPAWRER